MTYEQFKSKYPISKWLVNTYKIQFGDTVKAYAEDLQRECDVEVTYVIDDFTFEGLVTVEDTTRMITFDIRKEIMFYIDERPPELPKSCTCGAKYTSNTNYHLPYCDLSA